MQRTHAPQGLTMIDVLVGSFLTLVIFLALMGLLRASLLVASVAKAQSGAAAVGNTQMEYVRSLPYDSVGTMGGIPAGTIPQYATTTLNGVVYVTRTFIGYVDDPADGTDASDTNGITTDYKRIKVSVAYSVRGKAYEQEFVSNYAPDSIETSTGGGTLKVVVVDASGAPVPGASVRVVNAATVPAVDVTTFSDASGIVYLGGAATSTEYEVYVSKAGYSSAQTYARDATNQNPNPGYYTVAQNVTTTGTFAIDRLAAFTLGTYRPIEATSTDDSFADGSKLSLQSGTAAGAGTLHLANDASGYVSSGVARTSPYAPRYLAAWAAASTSAALPAGTGYVVHVTDGTSALIPDGALPGNSAGFGAGAIDLSGISTTTYPSLGLSFDLSTSDAAATPLVSHWGISATAGPVPVSGVGLTLTGTKTVGSTGAGAAIYKTVMSATTGAGGTTSQSLEWDSYDLAVSSHDVTDACSAPPYALAPGSAGSATLFIGASTGDSLLVSVRDSAGASVAGATVTLSGAGSGTGSTSSCGAAYFGGLPGGAYTVTISKTGYTTTSYTSVNVSGGTFYVASFP